MTTVITGAAGHLGCNLARMLLAQGKVVRALDASHDWRALEGLDVDRQQCDIRDYTDLETAFRGADVVYHTAGRISISRDDWPTLFEINVLGVRNVVEACLAAGVTRLVHFSSIHAFDQEPTHLTIDETRPLVQSTRWPPYDRSKAQGEQEVQRGIDRGLDAVIVNPTGIIGPQDYRPSLMGQLLLDLAHGAIPAMVDGGFDWVDVRDVARGAITAAENAPAGRKYILSGHWVSMRKVAETASSITGSVAPRITCPSWLARIGAPLSEGFARFTHRRPLFTSCSLEAVGGNSQVENGRARVELAYKPRPFAETIEDTYHWFWETGRLDGRSP